ncbi:hypothetical protein DENSPDRAFT_846649 [Dentipellis sp. KUC8613]|nr:hypothetical protein DENSPDRAFT_846649 [Dentipellis sp. KUC8613]
MDRTASPPVLPDSAAIVADVDHPLEVESAPDKISAYYSLVFPNFTYYLQTLTVTIGRRCIPNSTPSSSEQAQVDVDLGPLKSVSRLHAKIEYAEDEERFVLVVLGRNGAWVDGAWSGKGSRVPLGERSQIQIASRTFHFVLPPPPAPEDSPSPSSQSSLNRPRSPSVDITSLSPPSSLPSVSPPPVVASPPRIKAPPLPDPPQLPNSNSIPHGRPKTSGKKRKAAETVEAPPAPPPKPRPRPEDMPPKPTLTYSQLCYRAIKAQGGKATLQEILTWMMDNYDWYRYNEKTTGWEKSVRHNLSSNRAFKKLERSAGEKGKGFYWAVDEQCEHMFEEQQARAAMGAAGATTKEVKSTTGKKTKSGTSALEPALKRNVRGEPKSGPFTSTPLVFKTTTVPPPHAPTSSATPPVVKHEPTSVSLTPGPVPSSHPSASAAAVNDSSPTPHLAAPPIVLHENQLILNPTIFGHLTPAQLRDLEALGAQKALEILQGHIVRYLKERIRGQSGRGRGRGHSKRGRGAGTGGGRGGKEGGAGEGRKEKIPLSGPFTTAPLPSRAAQPPPPQPLPPPMQSLQPPPQPVPLPVTPAHVPMVPQASPPSPILVVDDDDPPEGPPPKRRRVDAPLGMEVGAVNG